MPKRRVTESQTGLPFSRSPRRERTLEVHSDNCKARFVAWYGTEEDADTETIDVEKCGLCGGDTFKRDVFKDTTIRLIAQVTARSQAPPIDNPFICRCDCTKHCRCYGQSEESSGVTIMQFELLTLVIGVFYILAYGFWMVTYQR